MSVCVRDRVSGTGTRSRWFSVVVGRRLRGDWRIMEDEIEDEDKDGCRQGGVSCRYAFCRLG